jgi:hypothetical protein
MASRTPWAIGAGLCALLLLACTIALFGVGGVVGGSPAVAAATAASGVHVGVASCAGSTCHGRQEATGKIVRQDELLRWQEASSPTGAHSRAFQTLQSPRSQAIASRLGLGSAASSAMCLSCHADPAPNRGPLFQVNDGIGCEGCHGGAQNWLASHTAVGASHAGNVAKGMVPLENARARASNCLDCHFGSDRSGQFVNHRIMAAGHPRLSFELDLFSTLQQHWNEDADYAQRKGRTSNVKMWAVGQAVALDRALSLYATPGIGQEGVFPEFYFFDCHTCHRRISDDPGARPGAIANPGRPIPTGMPAFNDENMIMLVAATRAAAPGMAARFEADSRAFHAALANDRPSAIRAAAKLRGTADDLAAAFNGAAFGRAETFAIIDAVTTGATAARYTDYQGSVQAVMATDTLLSALVNSGAVGAGSATSIRGDINRAYQAVREPNDYRPIEFRAALARAATAIRALR